MPATRTIALMNQKGGVGKTTTTVNLGAALAELGKRVCLIDLDPQAHLTINYGIEPSPEVVSLYNVLVDERPFNEAVHPVAERISVVPSSIDLAAAEIELVSVIGRESLLKRRIEAAQLEFDFILLDCPPSLGLLTINALAVATEVVIPMQPHFLALQGVGKLLETVALVNKRMNPALKVSGIVLTMFDAQTKLSGEIVRDLQGFIESAKGKPLPWSEARIFQTRIRRNIKLAESPSFGQHILIYDRASNGAVDYRLLAREVLGMSEPVPPLSVPAPAMTAQAPAAEEPAAAALPPAPPAVAPKPPAKRKRAYATRPGTAAAVAKAQATGQPIEVTLHAVDPTTLAAANVSAAGTAPSEPASKDE